MCPRAPAHAPSLGFAEASCTCGHLKVLLRRHMGAKATNTRKDCKVLRCAVLATNRQGNLSGMKEPRNPYIVAVVREGAGSEAQLSGAAIQLPEPRRSRPRPQVSASEEAPSASDRPGRSMATPNSSSHSPIAGHRKRCWDPALSHLPCRP